MLGHGELVQQEAFHGPARLVDRAFGAADAEAVDMGGQPADILVVRVVPVDPPMVRHVEAVGRRVDGIASRHDGGHRFYVDRFGHIKGQHRDDGGARELLGGVSGGAVDQDASRG